MYSLKMPGSKTKRKAEKLGLLIRGDKREWQQIRSFDLGLDLGWGKKNTSKRHYGQNGSYKQMIL